MTADTFELLDEDGRPLPGYLVSAGPAAMILVHEVFGLNEQIKNVARRLARDANVTTFAVDLYEGRTTLDLSEGYKMAQLIPRRRQVLRRWGTGLARRGPPRALRRRSEERGPHRHR